MNLNNAITQYKDKLTQKIEVSKLADQYAVEKQKAHYEYLQAKDELRAAEREAQEILV